MIGQTVAAFAVMGFLGLIFFAVLFFASRYKRCPSDMILVVYGRVGAGETSNCIHGGGKLVIPLIQDYRYLSLTPITIPINLKNALSKQNIRIDVPSAFTVGISTIPTVMHNAAERLLGLAPAEIEQMAGEIIFGQLRLTVASLTIEEINQDRERFLESIRENVEPELNKIGLYLINVNITDIYDESNYIQSIGKKAAAQAINQAKIDVAEQMKLGAIGESEANREKEIRVAENVNQSEKGIKKAESNRRIFVQQQESDAIKGENLAKGEMANSEAQLEVERSEARMKGEVAKRNADVEIQKAEYKAEYERLNAEKIVQSEIAKKMKEIAAEAEAERQRREAKGEADATLLKYEAEAMGQRKVLEGKARGYQALVDSCHGDTNAAATLLMVEKIEEIVSRQVEAIKNLKIDKITVWDSGSGEKGGGSSTANFLSSFIKSLPPLQDVSQMAGISLPDYLGTVNVDEPAIKNAPEAEDKKAAPKKVEAKKPEPPKKA